MLERAHAAAKPRAVPVVEQRPFLRGYHATSDQQIHLRQMNIEIRIGVRRGHVAVVDLLAGELHRAVTAYCAGRARSLGQSGPTAFEHHRVNRVAQVRLRLLVREDDAAGATDGFVGAGLLGMPLRVDQRVDASGVRRTLDRRKQRIGVGGKAAIDHQCAVRTRHRDHIASRALKQRRAAEIDR